MSATDKLKLDGIAAGAGPGTAPVQSVAGRTGNVVLSAADVAGLKPVATSGAYADLTGRPAIPAKTSDLTNDAGFIPASGAPVQSVAGKTGAVALGPSDVGAAAAVHAHGVATQAAAGFMSATDKLKLDGFTAAVLPPVNQGPAAGATQVSRGPELSGSAFASVGGADQHAASQWQIATDPNFTNIAYDSGETT